MVKYRFRVRLRQFHATDLPGKDLDPFVKVNFDSFKKFNTNAVSGNNPKWDTDTQFMYETQYADKLHRKRVVLQVYSKNTIAADDLVGQVDVDLKTLACGPVAQDVQLWHEGKPAGRLQFNCEMEEVGSVTVFVKDMLVSGLPVLDGEAPTTHVVVSVTNHVDAKKKDKVEVKTETKAATTDPEFQTFEQLRFHATIKELWSDSIEVRIYSDNKKKNLSLLFGTVKLPFEKYHSFKELAIVNFKEEVAINALPEFKSVAQGSVYVQGALYYKGFPTHSQMIGGVHTENGVADGKPVAKGVVLPPNLHDEAVLPPSHEEDDDHSHLSREHHAVSVNSVDEKGHSRGHSDAGAGGAAASAAAGGGLTPPTMHHRASSGTNPLAQPVAAPASGKGGEMLGGAAAYAASLAAHTHTPPPGGAAHHNSRSSVPVLDMTPSQPPHVAAPMSAPVIHHSNSSSSNPAAGVVYVPIVQPNTAFPRGIAGHCFACGKGADFVDSQTKVAVCGKDCKLVWLAYIAKNPQSPASAPAGGSHASPPSAAAAGPLPAGWEQKIDPGSGRAFYQNNVTKTTQWHRPDASQASVAPSAAAPVSAAPTPAAAPKEAAGWSCSGCTFLNADIAVKCVQCQTPKPGTSKPKPVEPALPAGHWSCSACTLANPPLALICSVCRAPKPLQPEKPAAASVPAVSSEKGWTCTTCTMFNKPTATKCDACLKPAPARWDAPPPPAASATKKKPLVEGLPAGWEAAWDNAHGRMYYKNHVTKKTQWEKPTQPAVKPHAAVSAAAAPAGATPLPPDIARLVQGGAQITAVYDPNAGAARQPVPVMQPQQILMASAGHHSAGHAPQPQIVYTAGGQPMQLAPGQRVVYANQPPQQQQMMHQPQQVIMMAPPPQQQQPQPIQVFRTADGRYVDASGRIVNL